jgi:DeoR/GlpR family transcriptional regulator of sugar metabolism
MRGGRRENSHGPTKKLTTDEQARIRSLREANDEIRVEDLARRFDVSANTIKRVLMHQY